MKIIMLSGSPNSGKTTVLNQVYDYLKKETCAKVIRPKAQIGGNPKDFECVLCCQGKQVAMFTMGDYVYEIVHAMSYYDGFGVDVLIVANSNKIHPKYRIKRYPGSVEIMKTMPLSDASNKTDIQAIIAEI